jgi:hypothetical protein
LSRGKGSERAVDLDVTDPSRPFRRRTTTGHDSAPEAMARLDAVLGRSPLHAPEAERGAATETDLWVDEAAAAWLETESDRDKSNTARATTEDEMAPAAGEARPRTLGAASL